MVLIVYSDRWRPTLSSKPKETAKRAEIPIEEGTRSGSRSKDEVEGCHQLSEQSLD